MNILASLVLYKHSFQEIELTLDSLLNEKNIDKLVIVDNGSFCTWLDDYKHYKVDVIRLPDNEGFGAGHNKVFEHYKNQCSYFLICNPDIYYAQGEVDKLFSFCKENLVDLSVPKIIYPNGALQYATKLLPAPFQLFGRRFLSSFFPLISAHAFCACRVCVKCAQTQISRLKNFIFQSFPLSPLYLCGISCRFV